MLNQSVKCSCDTTKHTEVNTLSYTHFTHEERESLAQLLREKKNYSQIARELGRHRSTIKREVERNYSRKKNRYHPWRATTLYIQRRKHSVRKAAVAPDSELYHYIQTRLALAWPPEVIAVRAARDGMPVSCSTIYRMIRKGAFGTFAAQKYLRRHGKHRHSSKTEYKSIHPVHTIHDRPAVVETKERFGDWEGDTVYGAIGKGCLVTAVDRKGKLLVSARSPSRKQEDIRDAFRRAFSAIEADIPVETLTLDNGSEFAAFLDIEKDLDTTIYFADPHSPWQRGLNENTNDLIRFFFPKGTDFLLIGDEEVQRVVSLINSRPRKTLDYLSPLEFFSKKCCT